MRVTNNTLFNNLRSQLSTNAERLLRAQEAVATQKRINRLSDDPVDGGRLLDLNGVIARGDQYMANITRALSLTDVQDTTLDQVNVMLSRAKELLLKEANEGTSTTVTRESTRIEIVALTSQLVQAANARFDQKYIFSGFATETPAFSEATVQAAATTVSGGATVVSQRVADLNQLTYHDYEIRFTGPNRFDVYDTTLGATVATDQAYASGEPIRIAGMEVTLADGATPPAAGDVFSLGATPPGVYQGDGRIQEVEIQAGSRVPLNLPGDRVFQGVGLAAGGADVFDVMNRINEALRTNDREAISGLLDELDGARTQISNARAEVGGRTNFLETVQQRHEDVKTNLQILKSGIEDIDVAEALINLQKQENIYEATLGAASKIVQPSLLDFLR